MTVHAWLRFAVAITCLACAAVAQGGETEEQGREQHRASTGAAAADQGKGSKGGKEGKEEMPAEDDAKLTPEQRLARNIAHGAGSYCRFVGAVRPAKLMPGQSGTMLVTALLQGAAVLPAPAPMEVLSPSQQGILTLGGMSMQPASLGRLASGYLGRPVYENYALLEIPVTMSPTATIGQKHSINVELKFDLYDGTSAQVIGRFLDHAIAEVEVGLAPDPAVPAGSARPETSSPAANTAPVVGPPPAAPVKSGNDAMAAPAVPVAVPAPAARAPEASAAAPELGLQDTDGDLPLLPIAVGGALLLVVIVLIARKK